MNGPGGVSEGACEMNGCGREREEGMDIWDMLHSDPVGQAIVHREIARQMIAKHLEDPEHHASLPLEFRHARGGGGWRAGGD